MIKDTIGNRVKPGVKVFWSKLNQVITITRIVESETEKPRIFIEAELILNAEPGKEVHVWGEVMRVVTPDESQKVEDIIDEHSSTNPTKKGKKQVQ